MEYGICVEFYGTYFREEIEMKEIWGIRNLEEKSFLFTYTSSQVGKKALFSTKQAARRTIDVYVTTDDRYKDFTWEPAPLGVRYE